MTLLRVPVIDLAPFLTGTEADRQAVARQVDQACRDIGFLVIRGHGVDEALIQRMRQVSREFFDLPLATKRQVARPARDVARGYIGLEEESLARSREPGATGSDLNESLMIGPVDDPGPAVRCDPDAARHFAPNLWPGQPAPLRETWTAYYRAMSALASDLMQVFALALGLDQHFFADKIDRHISRLRVRNYPAQADLPLPGQIRAGAHSDYGSLTILATEDRPGGLQVCNAQGEWVDVPIEPGCFIINIGDLMARWTNDHWVSTLHRVVNPPLDAGTGARRQSLVFFHNPNHDARIESLVAGQPARYAPTTSGAHLKALFTTTQNGRP